MIFLIVPLFLKILLRRVGVYSFVVINMFLEFFFWNLSSALPSLVINLKSIVLILFMKFSWYVFEDREIILSKDMPNFFFQLSSWIWLLIHSPSNSDHLMKIIHNRLNRESWQTNFTLIVLSLKGSETSLELKSLPLRLCNMWNHSMIITVHRSPYHATDAQEILIVSIFWKCPIVENDDELMFFCFRYACPFPGNNTGWLYTPLLNMRICIHLRNA